MKLTEIKGDNVKIAVNILNAGLVGENPTNQNPGQQNNSSTNILDEAVSVLKENEVKFGILALVILIVLFLFYRKLSHKKISSKRR